MVKADKVYVIDGVQYREAADKKPEIGGYLVATTARKDVSVGAIYKITGIEDDGYPEISDDVGDAHDLYAGQYVVLEPITQTAAANPDIIEHEGVKYRKVARKVETGDKYVLFTEERTDITPNKIYALYLNNRGRLRLRDDAGDERHLLLSDSACRVLEPIAPSDADKIAELERRVAELEAQAELEKAKAEPLKVGDYAKVIGVSKSRNSMVGWHDFEIGTFVEVKGDSPSGLGHDCYSLDKQVSQYVHKEDLVRATPEEIAEAQRKLTQDKIQPGVYVKLVIAEGERPAHGWGGVKNGEIGKVTRRNGEHVTVNFPSYGAGWRARIHELVALSDEEAEEQRKQAELTALTEQWAKIGRKVGEIRKGDVVRTLKYESGHKYVGTLGIATSDGTTASTSVSANGETWRHTVELVTPVESVVNLRATA